MKHFLYRQAQDKLLKALMPAMKTQIDETDISFPYCYEQITETPQYSRLALAPKIKMTDIKYLSTYSQANLPFV